MSAPLHWSLLFGPLPTVLLVIGAMAACFLIIRPDRRWAGRVLPLVIALASTATATIAWVINGLWRPFPDPLPVAVLIWVAVILSGLGLGLARLRLRGGWQKAAAVLAGIAVMTAGANQVNRYFGYFPSAAAVVGLPLTQEHPLPSFHRNGVQLVQHQTSAIVAQNWHGPAAMPTGGAVSQVTIPAVSSGFPARAAWIYLPPAYLTSHRPSLPVLMLITGQPGTSRGWIDAGNVIAVMDAFAATHQGLAPIVVMPDPLGSTLSNPLCTNSSLGQADAYLTRDVPEWLLANVQVDLNTQHWAVGGFSFGGTCALQLSVNHPRLFPTFLDISGQDAPTLGNRQRTLDRAFGGDARAFAKINPLDIFAAASTHRSKLPNQRDMSALAGTLVVGTNDHLYVPQQRHIQSAAVGAGVSIRWLEVPGAHSWRVAVAGLQQTLPWLSIRMGLT